MTLTLPAFLDALDDKLKRHINGGFVDNLDPRDLRAMLWEAREAAQHPTPALGWSEWLECCGLRDRPLPNDTLVEIELQDGRVLYPMRSGAVGWPDSRFRRIRYRCDPSGWLPRGDFVPPDVLWSDDCPVRVEWRSGEDGLVGRVNGSNWTGITHIRLVAREKAGEMPEGWVIDEDGWLIAPDGRVIFPVYHFRYGPDTIRRAVEAWLASMKERGNG